MPDKRPPADNEQDDQLPDWMREADPPADSSAAPKTDAPKQGVTGALPWMNTPDKAASNTNAASSTNTANDVPDWMQQSTDANADISGMGDIGLPDFDDLDWQAAMPANMGGDRPATPGTTGALPWRQGVSDPNSEPAIPAATDISWLDSKSSAAAENAPKPSESSTAPTLKKLLNKLAPEVPASPTAPPAAVPPSAATTARPSLRSLKSIAGEPPAAPPPVQPSAAAPQADMSNMTYDEWERSQLEREQAANRDPNDALLDAVPDWFENTTLDAKSQQTPADASTDNSPAAFTPDWFAGTGEPASAAPSWFDAAEVTHTPLSGAPAEPSTAAPIANDQPDWMSGSLGDDTGGVDFDALFGTPTGMSQTSQLPQVSASTETESDNELLSDPLDWMSDFNSSAESSTPAQTESVSAAPAEPIASNSAADLPDWMRDMGIEPPPVTNTPIPRNLLNRPPAPSAQAESSATPDISAEVPDWMRDMAPAEPTPIADPQALESAQDWFSDASASAESPAESLTPGELPDWLSSVEPGQAAAANAPRSASSAEVKLDLKANFSSSDIDALLNMPASQTLMVPPKDIDDRLASAAVANFDDLDTILGPAPEMPPETPSVTAESSESNALPLPSRPATAGQQASASGALRRLTPQQPAIPNPMPAVPTMPQAPDLARAEVPEYIKDLRAGPVALNIGGVQREVDEAPLNQLSDQMRQLRDRSQAFNPVQNAPPPATAAQAGSQSEVRSGVLSDLQGTLAAGPSVFNAAALPTAVAQTVISDMQARRVRVVQRLLDLDENETAAKAAPAKQQGVRVKIDRLLITVALLAALIIPFLTDAVNLVALPDTANPTPAQTAVFGAMDSLQSGQPVLVAFEYGPTGAGELDDLARVLLTDLFKKGAKPVIVSTNPSGVMHAESLLTVFGHNAATLNTLNRAAKPLVARADYVVLRYLPAGAAGVRSVYSAIYQRGFQIQNDFITDVEGQPSGLTDTNVSALAKSPVIVLAETPEDVRNWAEQYRALGDANPPKIVLAVAAAADATARTYSASLPQTLIGPLIGLRDATVYRAIRQPASTSTTVSASNDVKFADQRWQSTGLGALLAGVIIFLGSMFSLIQAVRRRGVAR